MGTGWSKRLLKAFNRLDIPTVLFVVFTTGGIDFVGGFTFYNLLQNQIFGDNVSAATQKLGLLRLTDHTEEKTFENGDEVHEYLFQSGSMKTPAGWNAILSYF